MESNIFQTASMLGRKVRFNYKGSITTEDLWDLKLSELDIIYNELTKEAKGKENSFSLINEVTEIDTILQLKTDLVKFIFGIKKAEVDRLKEAKKNKENNETILKLIEEKEAESLKGKTVEELRGLLK